MREPCLITDEQISALVDGEMPEREQRSVASHVAVCAACSERAGAVLAGKRLLGVKGAQVAPPANSWERIAAALEAVDGVELATLPARRPSTLATVPALALCGLLIIAASLAVRGRATTGLDQGSVFVRSHLAAVASGAPMLQNDFHDVVTAQTGPSRWSAVSRWLIPVEGELVSQVLYRVDDRSPVSEFTVSARLFEPDRCVRIGTREGDYWVGGNSGGVLVAWESNGLVRVLVGRTKPDDLIALAASRRSQSSLMPSY